MDGGLLGYQSRRLDPSDPKPKYLTYKNEAKGVQRLYYSVTRAGGDTCVLVEDALSAEKVGAYADAIALLTVKADTALRDRLISKYNHVIIWLDDDNVAVRKAQLDIKTLLDPYVKVSVIHSGKDPKRHSKDEIHDTIRRCM